MRVRLKTIKADARGTHHPGAVITVSDAEGADLVRGGYATVVAPPAAPAPAPAQVAAAKGDKTKKGSER